MDLKKTPYKKINSLFQALRESISFSGFSPTRPTKRVGRVGENPGKEVVK